MMIWSIWNNQRPLPSRITKLKQAIPFDWADLIIILFIFVYSLIYYPIIHCVLMFDLWNTSRIYLRIGIVYLFHILFRLFKSHTIGFVFDFESKKFFLFPILYWLIFNFYWIVIVFIVRFSLLVGGFLSSQRYQPTKQPNSQERTAADRSPEWHNDNFIWDQPIEKWQ